MSRPADRARYRQVAVRVLVVQVVTLLLLWWLQATFTP